MRLTLRTILAYLDDRLDPEHAQEIGAKIEDNDRAGELVHRIRDVMRSVRLSAPRMDRRAGGLDANTVAEYIDNHLSSERVADFERVCLESNVYLAEVACCHQILSLALGEAARIDPASRQAMYGILKAQDAKAQEAQAVKASPVTAQTNAKEVATDGEAETKSAEAASKPRKKPTVPEYLREKAPTSSRWRVAAVFGVAMLLVGVVLMAIQPEWFTSLWRPDEKPLATRAELEEAQRSADAKKSSPVTTKPGPREPGPEKDGPSTPMEQIVETPAGDPIKAGATPGVEAVAPVAEPDTSSDPKLPAAPAALTPPNVAAPGTSPRPPAVSTEPDKPLTPPLVVVPPAEAVKAVGKLMSDGSVLLRSPSNSPAWSRVANKGDVFPGDTLVFPPLFRSTVNLLHGITLQSPGETILELLKPATSDTAPGVRLGTGRLVVLTVGEANAQFPLVAANRRALVTLRDPGSTVGVEVKLIRTPGSNPIESPARVEVHIHVAAGSIAWDEAPNGPRLALNEGQSVVLSQDAPGEPKLATAPAWINSQTLTDGQRLTVIAVEEALRKSDAELTQSLLEIGASRRYEERALGLRCLAWIGRFGPTIDTLGDDREHARWAVHAETLRQALARGPLTAKQIQGEFQRKFPDNNMAKYLFRMLWGYSREQLQAGDAKQLVDYLDYPEREFRVLASWNLVDITGKSTNVHTLVDGMDALRRRIILQWRQRLESGQIVPPEPAAAPARPEAAPAVPTP